MIEYTVELARYAAGLRYGDLPPVVVAKAKEIIADTVLRYRCAN
jgi:hypothetical protein